MVEIDSEGELTRSEVAAFLREFASELDDGTGLEDGTITREEMDHDEDFVDAGSLDPKRITLIVGGDSATVSIPHTVEFDIEVESRSPMLSSSVSQEIEFELSWKVENPDEMDEDWIEIE